MPDLSTESGFTPEQTISPQRRFVRELLAYAESQNPADLAKKYVAREEQLALERLQSLLHSAPRSDTDDWRINQLTHIIPLDADKTVLARLHHQIQARHCRIPDALCITAGDDPAYVQLYPIDFKSNRHSDTTPLHLDTAVNTDQQISAKNLEKLLEIPAIKALLPPALQEKPFHCLDGRYIRIMPTNQVPAAASMADALTPYRDHYKEPHFSIHKDPRYWELAVDKQQAQRIYPDEVYAAIQKQFALPDLFMVDLTTGVEYMTLINTSLLLYQRFVERQKKYTDSELVKIFMNRTSENQNFDTFIGDLAKKAFSPYVKQPALYERLGQWNKDGSIHTELLSRKQKNNVYWFTQEVVSYLYNNAPIPLLSELDKKTQQLINDTVTRIQQDKAADIVTIFNTILKEGNYMTGEVAVEPTSGQLVLQPAER